MNFANHIVKSVLHEFASILLSLALGPNIPGPSLALSIILVTSVCYYWSAYALISTCTVL